MTWIPVREGERIERGTRVRVTRTNKAYYAPFQGRVGVVRLCEHNPFGVFAHVDLELLDGQRPAIQPAYTWRFDRWDDDADDNVVIA